MATMKLYELVNHYHIGTELTCAEAMFLACNEYYHLNLSEETRKMFSVMGLGMQTEHSCCGAFTVAVGIIGLMTAKEGQTDVSNMEGYQMIAELTEFSRPQCRFNAGAFGAIMMVTIYNSGHRTSVL